jgi:hypothetical protein
MEASPPACRRLPKWTTSNRLRSGASDACSGSIAAGVNDTFQQVGVAVGIAVWGAIFVGRGSQPVAEIAAGDPAAAGDGARRLLEAASSGDVHPALADPTRAGFLAGLNDVLTWARCWRSRADRSRSGWSASGR